MGEYNYLNIWGCLMSVSSTSSSTAAAGVVADVLVSVTGESGFSTPVTALIEVVSTLCQEPTRCCIDPSTAPSLTPKHSQDAIGGSFSPVPSIRMPQSHSSYLFRSSNLFYRLLSACQFFRWLFLARSITTINATRLTSPALQAR